MSFRQGYLTTGLAIIFSVAMHSEIFGQYWAALPPLKDGIRPSISFSQDEKTIFFLLKDSLGCNIYRIPTKGGTAIRITSFQAGSVLRAIHVGWNDVLFVRRAEGSDSDYHLYRLKDDGSGQPADITPSASGRRSILLGESYTGRYVYYLSDKVALGEFDCFRYDVEQNISQLVMPNDENDKVLSWSRDDRKLLVEKSDKEQLDLFDIQTTDYQAVDVPGSGAHFVQATLTPDGQHILELVQNAASPGIAEERISPLGSLNWKTLGSGALQHIDFSSGGKYSILSTGAGDQIKNMALDQSILLPEGAQDAAIDPKELYVAYVVPSTSGNWKLELYDLTKRTTTELAPLK